MPPPAPPYTTSVHWTWDLFFHKTASPVLSPTQPPIARVPNFFNWQPSGRVVKVALSLPSSTEIKNKWSCTAAPPIRLQTMDRVKFLFYPPDKMTCTSHGRYLSPARPSKARSVSPLARSLVTSYYYWYSALGPVWAETRVQSGDWYGSGTLHPGQVLRGSLPLLSRAV